MRSYAAFTLYILKDPPGSHEALKCLEIKNQMVSFCEFVWYVIQAHNLMMVAPRFSRLFMHCF